MLRGVIEIERNKIEGLIKELPSKYRDSMLFIKLKAGLDLNKENVPVELSEEEVDILLDLEITQTDTEIRKILTESIMKWRS